jgi:hypothetical protein
MVKTFFFLFAILMCAPTIVLGQSVPLKQVRGIKFPNSPKEGTQPILSNAIAPVRVQDLRGFNQLLPFVTPSPDQEDVNSCMLMSLTGIVEWWVHRANNQTRFVQNGPFDLSERWWMNLSTKERYTDQVSYWFTDAIYLFNSAPAASNREYPFKKGWYVETEEDIYPARPGQQKATYGGRYNWIDETNKVKGPFIKTPTLGRKVLLRNPEENPWAIGEAPEDIVQKVIAAFQKYQSPIQVIYNHEGYWHAVYVIGYDENMSSMNCPFTSESLASFQKEVDKSTAEGDIKRARKFQRYIRELNEALQSGGGCNPKGMFYVRDSQYSDPSEEIYVYDPANPQANRPYSKRIVLREFDWIRTMANHVSVIYPTQRSR